MVTCHPAIDPLSLTVAIPVVAAKVKKLVVLDVLDIVCTSGNVPCVSALPAASWLWR